MQTPDAPGVPQAPPQPGQAIIRTGVDAPQAVYRAFNAQRQELANQLENLEEKRREMSRQLADPVTEKAVKSGLEMRVGDLDKRIADVDKQLAASDLAVARAASVPGAVVPDPPRERNGPPEAAFVLGGIFIVVVLLPISIAYARRIWRRGAAAVTAFPQELADRLSRLDQAMDSIAIEVERIGEGQRFVTRVMSENGRSLGAGGSVPVDVGARGEKARVPREGERGGL